MGKVGSSTIKKSLAHADIDLPVYQVHFLSRSEIERVKRVYRQKELSIPAHLRRSRYIRSRIDAGEDKWLIVTLFREPIARKVSNIFENAHNLWPEITDDNGRIDLRLAKEHLHSELDSFDEKSDYTCTWFDKELRSVFSVDLFDQPFDHDRGYVIRDSSTARVLVLRLEELTSVFQSAMKEFFPDSPDIDMYPTNARSEQENAKAYQSLKEELTVSRETARRIYRSRYVQHLYPDSMIERFVNRWSSSA
jgi:hypothetical protein